jgi:hypothetical protein
MGLLTQPLPPQRTKNIRRGPRFGLGWYIVGPLALIFVADERSALDGDFLDERWALLHVIEALAFDPCILGIQSAQGETDDGSSRSG